MYDFTRCVACEALLPIDEVDLITLLAIQTNTSSMQSYDDLELWLCPYCDYSYNGVYNIDETIWYSVDEIKNHAENQVSDDVINLRRYLCCNVYRSESDPCNCPMSFTFEEADLYRYMNAKNEGDFYSIDPNMLDCRTCIFYGTSECDPYCGKLYEFATTHRISEKLEVCSGFKIDMTKVNTFPSKMLTVDLMNMKVDIVKKKRLERFKNDA